MINHYLDVAYRTAEGQITSSRFTLLGNSEANLDVTLPALSEDVEYMLSFDVDSLVSYVMYCDQDITIKTNSSGAPVDTIPLVATEQKVYAAALGASPEFTLDVTSLFITNATEEEAVLKIRILLDL